MYPSMAATQANESARVSLPIVVSVSVNGCRVFVFLTDAVRRPPFGARRPKFGPSQEIEVP